MEHPEADLIGIEEAAALLDEPAEQVRTMLEEGMLTAVGDADGEPRVRRAEVLAVRQMGG